MSNDRTDFLPWFEKWWAETGNPLHVWQAIAWCSSSDPEIELPGWCLSYLKEASKNIRCLILGIDFRDGETTISSEQAFALAPNAMGLGRQGQKNAFAKFIEQSQDHRYATSCVTGYKEFEQTLKDRAIAQIKADHNIDDDRAKRRLAKAIRGTRQG